ncbi:MAG: hypothetical protein AAF772_09695, partial [Acidobacteriota bacterium]
MSDIIICGVGHVFQDVGHVEANVRCRTFALAVPPTIIERFLTENERRAVNYPDAPESPDSSAAGAPGLAAGALA